MSIKANTVIAITHIASGEIEVFSDVLSLIVAAADRLGEGSDNTATAKAYMKIEANLNAGAVAGTIIDQTDAGFSFRFKLCRVR